MRVNVYAEEMTDRVELVTKTIGDQEFTGVRFYLELPVTIPVDRAAPGNSVRGPFLHRDGDDDSSAVTFWGKRDLDRVLETGLKLLRERHPQAMCAVPDVAAMAQRDLLVYLIGVAEKTQGGEVWRALLTQMLENTGR